MRWPRGRHNGRRIGGLFIKVELNVWWWHWHVEWRWGTLMVHLGPFHIWIEWSWDSK